MSIYDFFPDATAQMSVKWFSTWDQISGNTRRLASVASEGDAFCVDYWENGRFI